VHGKNVYKIVKSSPSLSFRTFKKKKHLQPYHDFNSKGGQDAKRAPWNEEGREDVGAVLWSHLQAKLAQKADLLVSIVQ